MLYFGCKTDLQNDIFILRVETFKSTGFEPKAIPYSNRTGVDD
jgi:hypothetical protein